jgi:uncharacterized protein (DUF1697 family)
MKASTYIALLRGINVSGQNAIRMPALRDSMARLGFQNVQTYLQSGNIVFQAPPTDESTLATAIMTEIRKDFGHEVPVLVLSAKTLASIANANPLRPKAGNEAALFHCTFLFQPVTPAAFLALQLPATAGERAVLHDGTVLLHCPQGYGRTKLNNSYFECALGVTATTRNWRTVLALQALCAGP